MSEETVKQEPRVMTKDEAYQYLLLQVERLDRDISTMVRESHEEREADHLWVVREHLLDIQKSLHRARGASAPSGVAVVREGQA